MATVPSISIAANDLHLGGAPSVFGGDQITVILSLVYFVAGIVAVIAIIIGGIRYTTSNGDSSQIKAAKDTVLYAVIGLIVVIMAAAITRFVIKGIGS
jgi:hypothetical protein